MAPEHIRFGGGAAETILHPVVACWMLVAVILIMILSRRRAGTAFLLACFTIPIGQVVLVGGLHFTVLRILILAGLARRTFLRPSEKFPGRFNRIDQALVFWTISALALNSLDWMDNQALIHNLGDFVDAMGGYLVVRFMIPDRDAILRTIKVLAVICLIQGVCMINEQITHINVFGLLGGVPIDVTLREGKIRSQGVLGCINAGTFAGILIPLFIWLWTEQRSQMTACVGIAAALAMIFASNSSTSLMALGGGLLGLAFWSVRRQMNLVRRGLALALLALHLVMNGPVWSLIARVDLTGSSSSYHRYYLVDNLIRHFSDWWLLGCKDYANWGWDMWDTCNQFVDVALKGGLLTLVLYILILKRSFAAIGNARKQVTGNRRQEWLLWCLGSALFANVIGSFGINYMAQLLMLLFMLLACISTATFETRTPFLSTQAKDQAHFASHHSPMETELILG